MCRIKKLKTSAEIMATVGVNPESLGCETCKPAIGSILSSLYNEHIMAPAHLGYAAILPSCSPDWFTVNLVIRTATKTRMIGSVVLNECSLFSGADVVLGCSLTSNVMVSPF